MAKITFLKEPGFTYDLLFAFMLYYNPDSGMKMAVNTDHAEEDKAYFQKALAPFSPLPEDLRIFFYLKDDNRFFMSEKYFDLQSKVFGTADYRLQNILHELSDYDKVIRNVLQFYFRDISKTELEAGAGRLAVISKWIKHSTYPENIKNALYDFFIEPIPLIQKLIHELLMKEIVLEQLYQKEYQKLLDVQSEFDYDWITETWLNNKEDTVDIRGYEKIEVSWCLFCKNIICYKLYSEKIVLMLGAAFKTRMLMKKNEKNAPDLVAFGVVVSEKNRIELLNLMVKNGAVTIKEIEQKLGFTATNAYYHIVLMQKAGMLKSGNQGRTIWYSIDEKYFVRLKSALDKYINA